MESPEKGTGGTPVTGSIEPVAVAVAVAVSDSVRGPGSGCFIATK